MFDLQKIWELMQVEPGHNLAQCILLFMIWWSSRGLKEEMAKLNESFLANNEETKKEFKLVNDKIENHEGRLSSLETKLS